MKILIDENLTPKLAEKLKPLAAYGIRSEGWAGESNGNLLRLMQTRGFTVLLTSDANLKHQQNLEKPGIAIVVFDIHKGTRKDQLVCAQALKEACTGIQPGEVRVILGPHPKRPA